MAKLPQISGKEMGRILIRLGFHLQSQKGNHMKFIRKHAYGKEVIVVPNHKVLRIGTSHNILRKLNLDLERFKEFV